MMLKAEKRPLRAQARVKRIRLGMPMSTPARSTRLYKARTLNDDIRTTALHPNGSVAHI